MPLNLCMPTSRPDGRLAREIVAPLRFFLEVPVGVIAVRGPASRNIHGDRPCRDESPQGWGRSPHHRAPGPRLEGISTREHSNIVTEQCHVSADAATRRAVDGWV